MARLIAACLILATLSGCARVRDSNYNPFNWFGGGRSAPQQVGAPGEVNPLIPKRRASIFRQEQDDSYRGTAVAQVAEIRVDRTQSGAVLRATGITAGDGAFDVRLVRDEAASGNGTIVFALRALQPPIRRQPRPERARRVTAGVALSQQDLAGARRLQVVAAGNSLSTRP